LSGDDDVGELFALFLVIDPQLNLPLPLFIQPVQGDDFRVKPDVTLEIPLVTDSVYIIEDLTTFGVKFGPIGVRVEWKGLLYKR